MAAKPKALFAKAAKAHEAGRWQEAEKFYKETLKADPQHADALHMLGYLAYQNGRNDIATDLVNRAIAVEPRLPAYHNTLGAALLADGKVDDAITVYRRALTLAPGSVPVSNNLANALQVDGMLDEAGKIYASVAAAAPGNGDVLYNVGYNYLLQGDAANAIAWLEKAAAAKPGDALIWNTLGGVFHNLRRSDDAIAAYSKAIVLAPDTAALHKNLAIAYHAAERWAEARDHYDKVLALEPTDAFAHNAVGVALERMGLGYQAEAAYAQALALKPDYAEARNNLASLKRDAGDFAGALELYGKAIADDPFYTQSYLSRAELVTAAPGDAAIDDLQRMAGLIGANDPRLPPGKAVFIHFALAKALADTGDHAGAFAQMNKGNALKRAMTIYNRESTSAYMRGVAEVFTKDRLAAGAKSQNAPIFIVGMPRSGTTLIEQILASHPDVRAMGESAAFDAAARGVLGATSVSLNYAAHAGDLAKSAERIAVDYLDRIAPLMEGRTRSVDKQPGNFLNIGVIRMAFPHARIVHAVRDPVDTCVSCYSKLFREAQNFTYDLGDLGRYYRDYRELMAHWKSVLPEGAILDLAYEDVVRDLEGSARRLLAYCGLAWNDDVLEFYRTRRPIAAAAALQVRQPMYSTAIGRAKPYEAYLGPLREALK